eukprot:COSAG03_NODE_14455_length_463_cov_4.137363_1_plen_75_part_01
MGEGTHLHQRDLGLLPPQRRPELSHVAHFGTVPPPLLFQLLLATKTHQFSTRNEWEKEECGIIGELTWLVCSVCV